MRRKKQDVRWRKRSRTNGERGKNEWRNIFVRRNRDRGQGSVKPGYVKIIRLALLAQKPAFDSKVLGIAF